MYVGAEYVSELVAGACGTSQSSNSLSLVNPATEQRIAEVPDSNAADVDAAILTAEKAGTDWASASPEARAASLSSLADIFETRQGEMADLVTAENGSPQWWTQFANGAFPVSIYRSSAAEAAKVETEQVRTGESGRTLLRTDPLGVVGIIVPWNAPQALLAGRVGAALAAGCTVVVKPSPETSLDALLLEAMAREAGLPAGVINIVTGGRETGEALVRHPGTKKIAFVGSTATGRSIASICGQALKPVTAEMGGKSAAILLEDADLGAFRRQLVQQCLPYSGQVCFALTRVLAPASRYGEVVDALVTELATQQVGDPTDPATIFGPIVSSTQRDKVEGYIAAGIRDGARLVLGSTRSGAGDKGYYVSPAVFTDVDPRMSIFREEIFGPVLVVVAYDDDQAALALANDSDYGLSGAVFSKDTARATELARGMQSGQISINGEHGAPGSFTAGLKNSGIGSDTGLVVGAYQQSRSILLGSKDHANAESAI